MDEAGSRTGVMSYLRGGSFRGGCQFAAPLLLSRNEPWKGKWNRRADPADPGSAQHQSRNDLPGVLLGVPGLLGYAAEGMLDVRLITADLPDVAIG